MNILRSCSPGPSRTVSLSRTAVAIILFGLTASSMLAQATLTGTVTNSATGQALEGARVLIQGTNREVFTDGQGTYRFDNLPPGEVVVSASYTGLDPTIAPTTIAAGAANRRDLEMTSDIYRLSKFVVAGEREGNALAVTLQRQAANVKNVVSSDAFGSLAGNPAELLERITGVVVERVGGDARFISIRGVPGGLNSVQIDG